MRICSSSSSARSRACCSSRRVSASSPSWSSSSSATAASSVAARHCLASSAGRLQLSVGAAHLRVALPVGDHLRVAHLFFELFEARLDLADEFLDQRLGHDLHAHQVLGRQLARLLQRQHRLQGGDRHLELAVGRARAWSAAGASAPATSAPCTQRRVRLRPANLISSKEMPAISGTPTMRVSTSQYQAGRPIGANTKMATTITTSRKLVPQRGCSREKRWALGAVSGSPGLEAGDRLVLGAVVLEHPPQVFDPREHEHVAEEQGRADAAPRPARTAPASRAGS